MTDHSAASIIATNEQPSWLAELYRESWHPLCNYLRRRFGLGPPEPEEIAQAAFTRLAALGANAQPILQPRPFLYRTAVNLVISERRHAAVEAGYARDVTDSHHPESGFEKAPESVLLSKEILDIIEAVIRLMPQTRQRCFVMHRFDGLSFAEIGRQIGMSAPGVRKHVERTLEEIEKALDRKGLAIR